ncbi:hypothetical protein ACFVT2_06000 [Streptomyces sp. NPDC058000]|uniref:hypothetical protein n=1 Tax=Streptomyces sp. NPDC058000 TaxID=3346299 RepID=UPI0036E07728
MTGVTASASASRATRAAVSSPISAKSTAVMRRSEVMERSASWSSMRFTEETTTVPAVITARPTMRVVAVAAVRRGLRRAFSTASLPRMPASRVSGERSSPVTPRASSGVRTISPIRRMGTAPKRRFWLPTAAATSRAPNAVNGQADGVAAAQ